MLDFSGSFDSKLLFILTGLSLINPEFVDFLSNFKKNVLSTILKLSSTKFLFSFSDSSKFSLLFFIEIGFNLLILIIFFSWLGSLLYEPINLLHFSKNMDYWLLFWKKAFVIFLCFLFLDLKNEKMIRYIKDSKYSLHLSLI